MCDNSDIRMLIQCLTKLKFCMHLFPYDNVSLISPIYRTWEIFGRVKNWQIWRIMSYPPKFSSPIFTDTPKMPYGICTDCSLFANFSSPIAFTCTVHQNFPRQIFPVYGTTTVQCYIDYCNTIINIVTMIKCFLYHIYHHMCAYMDKTILSICCFG